MPSMSLALAASVRVLWQLYDHGRINQITGPGQLVPKILYSKSLVCTTHTQQSADNVLKGTNTPDQIFRRANILVPRGSMGLAPLELSSGYQAKRCTPCNYFQWSSRAQYRFERVGVNLLNNVTSPAVFQIYPPECGSSVMMTCKYEKSSRESAILKVDVMDGDKWTLDMRL